LSAIAEEDQDDADAQPSTGFLKLASRFVAPASVCICAETLQFLHDLSAAYRRNAIEGNAC
jgi:hypothetical protein